MRLENPLGSRGFASGVSVVRPCVARVGAAYGQLACPDQYLVEFDLTQPDFQGHDLFVSARWSLTLPASPCDARVTMGVSVFDGVAWQQWDDVVYIAIQEGTVCHDGASSHSNTDSAGLDGTNVPAARAFIRTRVAVRATRAAEKQPILVIGDTVN